MDTLSYIIGRNSAGGGTATTPTWSEVTNKPFETVGEGLEVSNGALKEAVPVWHETSTQEQTDSTSIYIDRDSTITYSDEFYQPGDEAKFTVDEVINQYNDSMEVTMTYYRYDETQQASVQVTLNAVISDVMSDHTETDSAGKQWNIYCTYDAYRFSCLDGYDGYDLHVVIDVPDASNMQNECDFDPIRTEVVNYQDSFTYWFQPQQTDIFRNKTEDPDITWTWYDGMGYSVSAYTVSVSGWDYTDSTAVYTDDGNHRWHLYITDEVDGMCFHAVALDSLPSGPINQGSFSYEITYMATIDTYHQLPAQYIPIDENTIQIDGEGKLTSPSSGVQSVYYNDWTGSSGTNIGSIVVDGEGYNVYSGTVDWSDVQNKPEFATVATSGDYGDLSNTPTIPQPTSVTVTQTLQSGTAIADIDVDGVTTTLYAPQGGGSTDWADITNKPNIAAGTNSSAPGVILAQGVGGNASTASDMYAIAQGGYNKASGMCSAALGSNNTSDSPFSLVEGYGNNQVGDTAHAQGKYKYKWPWRDATFLENDVADSIGNGTSNSNRSCAEVTTWTGDKFLSGDIYTHVTNWGDPRSNSIKLANIPVPPTTAGTYSLQVVVDSDGNPTYSWI